MSVQKYINHVGLVLDKSSSMQHSRVFDTMISVADNQVKHLAQRSTELDQETRVTAYAFSDTVTNLVYDQDVLRLPSFKGLVQPYGYTALIDATLKAIDDLEKTATLYGDHAFLIYVLTDGEENESRTPNKLQAISQRLQRLPDNWTVACFVPNANGVYEAKKFGFPAGNISVWDTSERGMNEVGETIRRTTDSYMQARSTGVFRGTSGLFTLDASNLTPSVVTQTLTRLRQGTDYNIFPVLSDGRIDEFVLRSTGKTYTPGKGYYELTKREKIQAGKQLAVLDNDTLDVYTGANARQVLGLPDYEMTVGPAQYHGKYSIFVQSTSLNRKLITGQRLLVLK